MEFDSLKNSEVNQFRGKMKALADQMQADRRRQSWLERLLYQFAPSLAASTLSSNVLPTTVTRRLRDDNFSVVIKFDYTEVLFKCLFITIIYTLYIMIRAQILMSFEKWINHIKTQKLHNAFYNIN